jgi:hypothetical protein
MVLDNEAMDWFAAMGVSSVDAGLPPVSLPTRDAAAVGD